MKSPSSLTPRPVLGNGLLLLAGSVAVLSVGAPRVEAGCPVPARIEAQLAEAGLERAARTARFSTALPQKLYRKAGKNVGEVVTSRDGKKIYMLDITRSHIVVMTEKAGEPKTASLEKAPAKG